MLLILLTVNILVLFFSIYISLFEAKILLISFTFNILVLSISIYICI